MAGANLQFGRQPLDGFILFTLYDPELEYSMRVFPYVGDNPINSYIVQMPYRSFALRFEFNYEDEDYGDLWRVYVLPYKMEYQPLSGYDFSLERLVVDDESDFLDDSEVI